MKKINYLSLSRKISLLRKLRPSALCMCLCICSARLQAEPFKHDGLFIQFLAGGGQSEVTDMIHPHPFHRNDPRYTEEYRLASASVYVTQFSVGYTVFKKGFVPYINALIPIVSVSHIASTGLENRPKDKKHNYYYQGLNFGLIYYITSLIYLF